MTYELAENMMFSTGQIQNTGDRMERGLQWRRQALIRMP
jgi:hypothetical protein